MFIVKVTGRDPVDHEQREILIAVQSDRQQDAEQAAQEARPDLYEREVSVEEVVLPVQYMF